MISNYCFLFRNIRRSHVSICYRNRDLCRNLLSIERDGEQQSMNDNSHTWREIQQQPASWPTTVARVRQAMERLQAQARLKDARVVITGTGTSAYVAAAVAAAWPRSVAVPSTDLLAATERYIEDPAVLVSVGRSGDSPESMVVVERVHRVCCRESAICVSELVLFHRIKRCIPQ